MGITSEHTVQYRYPGTKFFESYQQAIFFGREQEANRLIDSIKAYDVFVIFADSGIGKTSLLNAALIPRMEKENMLPIKVRFQDTAKPPLQAIFQQLAPFTRDAGQSAVYSTERNLWRLFKSCHFNNHLPILVFDQFEEFFNHSKQLREACTNDLADLVNEYLPDYIREEMRVKFKEKDPTPEEQKYYAPARLKMLFLIRADKLTLMDDMCQKMPLILRNRFHLKPLNVKQAEQAIVLPALLPQNGFASPSFNFQEEAITDICHYLENEEGEVESFQLQILCQELEKRIIDRYERKEKSLWISKEELGGEVGMDSITKNYYNNQVASIKEVEMRKKALELIEDKLIVEDRRISLPEDFLIKEGYGKALLDYLLNTRLVRVYNDRDSRYFEISHDRLLPSIIKSKQQRQEEEIKLNQQRELQRIKEEQEEKNRQLLKEKEEERKSLIIKLFLALTIVFLVLSIILISVLLREKEAKKQTKIELIRAYLAKENLEATISANSVLKTFNLPFSKNLENLKDSINISYQYFNDIQNGDNLFHSIDSFSIGDPLISKLLKAKDFYIRAQQRGFIPNNYLLIGQKFKPLNDKIDFTFVQYIDSRKFFRQYNYEQKAQEAYTKAQRLYISDSDNLKQNFPYAVSTFKSYKKI